MKFITALIIMGSAFVHAQQNQNRTDNVQVVSIVKEVNKNLQTDKQQSRPKLDDLEIKPLPEQQSQKQQVILLDSNSSDQLNKKFEDFKIKYGKNYKPQDLIYRFSVFQKNQNDIKQHNAKKSTYQMAVNKFADLTNSQFSSDYLMKPEDNTKLQKKITTPVPQIVPATEAMPIGDRAAFFVWPSNFRSNDEYFPDYDLPKSIDWRKKIRFSAIKDQGRCAACYAFSIMGAVQLNWAYKYQRKQPILSEQQIVDCCQQAGFKCSGCTSGNLGSTLDYLKNGIAYSQDYPYAGKAQSCNKKIRNISYLKKSGKPYDQLYGVQNTKYHVLKKGPVAVAIDSKKWKFYKKGIFNDCPEQFQNLNYTHSAVIIGIQEDGTWIIRNSWGENWGEKGYIRLQAGNSCGITDYVFYPLIR